MRRITNPAMRRIRTGGLVLAALTVVVFAQGAPAATLKVTKSGDPVPGACTANDCSLREAVREANSKPGPDRIVLKATTYELAQVGVEDDALAGDLDVIAGSGALTLVGKGARKTAIDGNGLDRLLYVPESASASIKGVALRGGNAVTGGAVLNEGRLAVQRVLFRGNDASSGAGVYNNGDGDARLSRVVFQGNAATGDGGGLYTQNTTSVKLNRTVFRKNEADGRGGAIYTSNEAVLSVKQSTIDRNDAGDDGGGLFNQNEAQARINDSTISRNTAADEGGGIYTQNDSLLILVNSTLSGNNADDGGAIYANNWPYIRVDFSTITKNRAETTGGAIFDQTSSNNVDRPPPFWELRGTIVAANTSPGIDNCALHDDSDASHHESQGSNLEDEDTCFFEHGSDESNTAAGLRKLARNGGPTKTNALKRSSDAVNAAPKQGCPKRDQRGVKRPQGKRCDSGAYELKRR